VILFSRTASDSLMPIPSFAILRVAEAGGAPVPSTRLDKSKGETSHGWPSFLPDGRHFLFTAYAEEGGGGVYAASLDSPQVTQVLPQPVPAQYVDPGYLLFRRDNRLIARPFDPARMRVPVTRQC
jgi:eukaryotic-like serine/threonine-protein kinase